MNEREILEYGIKSAIYKADLVKQPPARLFILYLSATSIERVEHAFAIIRSIYRNMKVIGVKRSVNPFYSGNFWDEDGEKNYAILKWIKKNTVIELD